MYRNIQYLYNKLASYHYQDARIFPEFFITSCFYEFELVHKHGNKNGAHALPPLFNVGPNETRNNSGIFLEKIQ